MCIIKQPRGCVPEQLLLASESTVEAGGLFRACHGCKDEFMDLLEYLVIEILLIIFAEQTLYSLSCHTHYLHTVCSVSTIAIMKFAIQLVWM